jgi:HEAT repeat protein
MRTFRPELHFETLLASLGVLLFTSIGLLPTATAQVQDPVEKVRQTLTSPLFLQPEEIKYRKETLDKTIANLRTPAELRRALELSEWTDNDYGNAEVSTVDRAARKKIAEKLVSWISDAVDRGDTTAQLAAATFVGEMGTSIRALTVEADFIEPIGVSVYRDGRGFGQSLAPYLIKLTGTKRDHAVRQTAARALGKVNADPKVAVPALEAVLRSSNAGDREAASEALANMVTNVSLLSKAGRVQSGVTVLRDNVVDVAAQVVAAAGPYAAAPETDPVVRGNSLKAIVQAATSFNELIPDPREVNKLLSPKRPLSDSEKRTVKEFSEVNRDADKLFPPLIAALQKQGKVLAWALEDPDEQNRILSRRALEWMARLRLTLLALPDAVKAGDKAPDPLLDALAPSLKVFSRRLKDPDVAVRRASLDFLEQMETAIGPAIPAVRAALADPDRFIRWAAARTLREIGHKNIEASAAETVPALARLLGPDEDPDVRESAATTLRYYGDLARPALPALIAAVEYGELEQRDSLIKAIQYIGGPNVGEAVPALRKALFSKSPLVRKAAADALGTLNALARPAIDDLRLRLNDEDATVRAAASEALLLITRPK